MQRISLFKFLSDEVLSSAIIREHLDQGACLSADLQQKLRSLTSECKALKSREGIVAANLSTKKIKGRNVGSEFRSDALPSIIVSDGQVIGQLFNRSNGVSSCAADNVQVEDVQHLNGSDNNRQQGWSFGS